MAQELKFYYCTHCKEVIEKLYDGGPVPVCCGEKMEELKPNTVDAATEKHVPAVKVEGNTVQVQIGDVIHPMLPEHFIGFICLQTEQGHQIKPLKPEESPTATFAVAEGDKPVRVYEWCTLHGLWKKEI